jgi:hypothetical protein
MDALNAMQETVRRRRGGLLGRWLDPRRELVARPAPFVPSQPSPEQPDRQEQVSEPDDVFRDQAESAPVARARQPEPAPVPEPEQQWTVPDIAGPPAPGPLASDLNQPEGWLPPEVAAHVEDDQQVEQADATTWARPASASADAASHAPAASDPDEWVAEPSTAERRRDT